MSGLECALVCRYDGDDKDSETLCLAGEFFNAVPLKAGVVSTSVEPHSVEKRRSSEDDVTL